MNKIEIKKLISETGWKYYEIIIDGISLDNFLFEFTQKESLKGLVSAWLTDLESKGEQEYIKECLQTESEEGIAIPILLCPEDLDFWCIVVIAKIRYTNESVIWDKIGLAKRDNWNTKAWSNSGIRNFENWTEEEWDIYGSYFDIYDLSDKKWDMWVSDNWHDEEKRRLKNYTHQYFNNDKNIEWFDNVPKLIFDKVQYKQAIKFSE